MRGLWLAALVMASNAMAADLDLEVLDSGIQASLRGIAVHGADTVWVTGSDGTVLRSTDAGATWRDVAPPDTAALDFRDIQITGPKTALLMSVGNGETSRIYKTGDGGQTWRVVLQNTDEKAFFNGLAFWDDANGLLTSDPIDGKLLLFRTADGGQTWKRIGTDLPPLKEGEYGFAASGTLIAATANTHAWLVTGGQVARVFHSGDRGEAWTVADTPMRHGEPSTGIFSAAFRDAKRGVIVGGDYKKPELSDGNVFWTDDGGATWTVGQTGEGGMGQKACVVHLGPGRYLAIGRTGLALSVDDGHSWKPASDASYYTGAVGDSGKVVYLAGADGHVARIRLGE